MDDVSASFDWESKDGLGMSADTMTKRCWRMCCGEKEEAEAEADFLPLLGEEGEGMDA
jgi:hypothetical protein